MTTFFNAPRPPTLDPVTTAVDELDRTNKLDTLIRQMASGNTNATKEYEDLLNKQQGGSRKNNSLYYRMRKLQRGGNRTYDTVNVQSAMTPGSISTPAPNSGLYVGQPCVGGHCGPAVNPTPNQYFDYLVKTGDALNPEAITSASINRLGNSTDLDAGQRYTNFNPSYRIQCGAGRRTRRKLNRRRRRSNRNRRH